METLNTISSAIVAVCPLFQVVSCSSCDNVSNHPAGFSGAHLTIIHKSNWHLIFNATLLNFLIAPYKNYNSRECVIPPLSGEYFWS